eukprot:13419237-Heterocapsa_arctica.AAC.1
MGRGREPSAPEYMPTALQGQWQRPPCQAPLHQSRNRHRRGVCRSTACSRLRPLGQEGLRISYVIYRHSKPCGP